MLRFKKVILSVVLVLAMMAAAGCGSKSADNVPQVEGAEFIEQEEQVSKEDFDGIDQGAEDSDQEDQAQSDQQEETAEKPSESQDTDVSHETSDQEEDQDISDEASADDVLAAINSVKEETFTDEELQEIYSSIQEAVKREYLDPNGIEPKDFKWPKSFDLDGFDEDNAWLYFDYISAMYMSTGKFTADGFTADMPSEQNQQLMNAVLNGMIAWDQSSGNNDFGLIKIVLVPSGEKIPANVNFSD